jgi:hypothetical protein
MKTNSVSFTGIKILEGSSADVAKVRVALQKAAWKTNPGTDTFKMPYEKAFEYDTIKLGGIHGNESMLMTTENHADDLKAFVKDYTKMFRMNFKGFGEYLSKNFIERHQPESINAKEVLEAMENKHFDFRTLEIKK